MHQQTKSKKIINTLPELKKSIPYNNILQIETLTTPAIAEQK